MTYFPFLITEHVIDGQYIREYPRATVSQSARLKLAIKKYTPIDNTNPQPGDVTIELYEPLWEDLLAQSHGQGFRIGSIWIADTANLGASGIINENDLGDDPSWLDHSRDLLLDMVPCFHYSLSRGAIHGLPDLQLSNLQKRHKRWDPRVLERWIQHAYRDLPTVLYPRGDTDDILYLNASDPPVTLASSKHQEVMQYIRPNFGVVRLSGQRKPEKSSSHGILDQPDVIGPPIKTTPFYRSEPAIAWKLLEHIRPSVLYIFGERSPISTAYIRTELTQRTGAGIGGNGGIDKSKVKESLIARSGHQAPLEDVRATASSIGEWIGPAVREWKELEERIAQTWENQTAKDKLSVSVEWLPYLESACRLPALEPSKL
ncbi:uncharacterized protein LDX57_010437 [Aspergillus melleus]|uniref:uncharacterized protein n=1 Tax=Aspergillus melleus TaxID=138277 RepID=UPI001E8DA875|nr:uncharacterized protein LDX57_010437 [Aspergillus melleus]KAH8432808.1 hypothetical protein LDX57_010437 [Aspergillus melleus]